MPVAKDYELSVFLNCPFDNSYFPIRNAIVFAMIEAGCVVRCALERANSASIRIKDIAAMISNCRYGIHDISCTELDKVNSLPRFNMPLELGLFLGAVEYGSRRNKQKVCLVLDREPYRYQKFISDISGQDIKSHDGEAAKAVAVVRDWLSAQGNYPLPGPAAILGHYESFQIDLPSICADLKVALSELSYTDFVRIATTWIRNNPL